MNEQNVDTKSPKFLVSFFLFGAVIIFVAFIGSNSILKHSR